MIRLLLGHVTTVHRGKHWFDSHHARVASDESQGDDRRRVKPLNDRQCVVGRAFAGADASVEHRGTRALGCGIRAVPWSRRGDWRGDGGSTTTVQLHGVEASVGFTDQLLRARLQRVECGVAHTHGRLTGRRRDCAHSCRDSRRVVNG